MEFNLDTTIKELHELGIISVRTYNSLHYAGMDTLGEILENIETPMDLLNLRNFGRKAYTEIEVVLNKMIKEHTVKTVEISEDRFLALGETIVNIITNVYTEVTAGDSEVKAYLQAAYPHPSDMHFLVMGEVENMLTVVEDYSREENLEIRHSYKQFMEGVLHEMEGSEEVLNGIYKEYKSKSMEFSVSMESFTYEQIAKYFLSPIASDYLEKTYQEQRATTLSVRSNNFSDKFLPHFADLIKYADEPLASYRNICPGQSMMKTLTEIFQFNQRFKREFDRVAILSDDDIQTEFLKRDYPFLMNRQRQFVFEFIKEHHHAPLFFLMYHYLRLSESKSDKIYCLANGIFDGRRRTLNEIAEVMDLSRERVRQIVYGTIVVQDSALANNDGWDYYYELFDLPFIYERTERYVRLKEAEHLPADFEVFASLVN